MRPFLDTAMVNGRVRPAPDHARVVEALGIRDGGVVALGSTSDIRALMDQGTTVVDLQGRTVLPAFTDSHTHFHRGAVLRRLFLDFETLQPGSVTDVVNLVRRRAAETPAGGWIQGDGLSTFRLAEARLPDRYELDAVAPDHPVLLRGIGKHVVAANSAALAAAGIDRETGDPAGGRIERDARGEPTGVLHERAKLRLDTSHPETVVPSPSRADRLDAIRGAVADLHRVGVTTIHEMVRTTEEIDDLSALHAAGQLDVRVRIYYRVWESTLSLDALTALGIRRGLGDDWFRVLGVKISVDGFCIFRNAAVYEHYSGQPTNTGILRIGQPELEDLVRRANAQGLQVAVHAVGVRAVDAALAAFEAAGPPVAGPHRIEHAYLDVDGDTFARMRGLGLALSTQPGFLAAYRREWNEIFDPGRLARIMPLQAALELGIPLLFNSDFPCSPIDPLSAIRLAGERAVPVTDAWRAVTTTPAEVAGDCRLGRLDIGRRADLIVVEDDPLESRSSVASTAIWATMVDGRFVFHAREAREA